jgi:hypothetical protein
MWARAIIVILSLWLVGVCRAQADSLSTCDAAMQQAAAQAVSTYKPSGLSTFIRLENGQFWNNAELFIVRGVNYMPAQTPQYHFLIDTPDTVVRGDLGRFKAVGLNTIRIFLWHDGLFMCEGSGTVPLPGAVRFLDRFFAMTAEAGLRVIVTLNDQPDLDSDPIYENPTLAWQQFEYLVTRYANEPAILAWDVRSAGDVDYGANPDIPARFTKERVLTWLRRAVRTVKGLDTNHPVTASWQFAPLDTEPYVDFISLHRPASLDEARQLINEIKAGTTKPLLLAGYGISTYDASEADQSAAVLEYIALSDRDSLLGWLVWQAYDFPVNQICSPMPCRAEDGASLHEGLWQSNNTAKAVVLDLKLHLNKASALGNPTSLVTATPTAVILTPMATALPTATP